jgi:hypothetical protein
MPKKKRPKGVPFFTEDKEPADTRKRLVFTGGSGTVGQHVILKLLQYGHEILNVDLNPQKPSTYPQFLPVEADRMKSVHTLNADLTDGAQAYIRLSCHFKVSEPFPGPCQDTGCGCTLRR